MWCYDLLRDLFWHSDTLIVILGEDMPVELADVPDIRVMQAPKVLLP